MDVFEVSVAEENLPDNYFSDLDANSKYYCDVLLAVEFGIVDVEAGDPIRPNDPIVREFAAHTLNYCLGFEFDEGVSCTFSDADEAEYPVDDQVAWLI